MVIIKFNLQLKRNNFVNFLKGNRQGCLSAKEIRTFATASARTSLMNGLFASSILKFKNPFSLQ